MADKKPNIVVVTPVKNEAWILERFLSVTSQFADHIIIADQQSTDGSRDNYPRFPKVTLIENTSAQYNEAERQLLLIAKARELVPLPRIILALDADEILAADAIHSPGWQCMLKAKPGTVIWLEKPDLFDGTRQCYRAVRGSALGYVDDGVEHHPKKIHSIRVPTPTYATNLEIADVKVIHYACSNLSRQTAKMRYYSVQENVLNTSPRFFTRRRVYGSTRDLWDAQELKPCPPEWFKAWEDIGIDMRTIPDQEYYWQDYAVLDQMQRHGVQRFWLDDIWSVDWNKVLAAAAASNSIAPGGKRIKSPPKVLTRVLSWLDVVYARLYAVKHKAATL